MHLKYLSPIVLPILMTGVLLINDPIKLPAEIGWVFLAIAAFVFLTMIVINIYKRNWREWDLLKYIINRKIQITDASKMVYQKTRAANIYGYGENDDYIFCGVDSLLLDGRAYFPIYGLRPNSAVFEPIPPEDQKNFHLGPDNRTLLDRSSQPAKIKWRNLSIRSRDLSGHIDRQREEVRKHLRQHGSLPVS